VDPWRLTVPLVLSLNEQGYLERQVRRRRVARSINENPKSYRWTKSAEQILSSVKRFCQRHQQTLCAEL
jgi:hypothetical protein